MHKYEYGSYQECKNKHLIRWYYLIYTPNDQVANSIKV